jgi:putative phosphoribosyl transferase
MIFKDRQHAGELLAKQVEKQAGKNTVVVGIPRGGIVVAKVVADRLKVPLDFIAVEKIGAPGNSEFAIGALGPENQIVLDKELADQMGIPADFINKAVGQEGIELEMKERTFRDVKPPEELKGKTVILVDDGIATGATGEVAIKSIRAQNPGKLILAVPVAPQEALRKLEPLVDELFCLVVPSPFMAVGQFYENFGQTENKEVIKLLREA